MAIRIPKRHPAPVIEIDHLKGAAKQLALLVQAHGTYAFEGFQWLQGTYAGIADHLGVDERTIKRAVKLAPFHHITRHTDTEGRHVLIKLGTEPCETDHVFKLRAVWCQGLAFFNVAASKAWATKVVQLQMQKAPPELWTRLQHRITACLGTWWA